MPNSQITGFPNKKERYFYIVTLKLMTLVIDSLFLKNNILMLEMLDSKLNQFIITFFLMRIFMKRFYLGI